MNNKLNVYLFYGEGCPYCIKAKVFFKKLSKENTNYNLIEYEVWHNDANKELLTKVATKLHHPAKTVPYIVIVDNIFEDTNKEDFTNITNAINDYTNNKNYLDIVNDLKGEK
jgi:glutaredoxin